MPNVAACEFLHVTPSYLAARLALLLRIDVDGGLVDARERVVTWIVSGRLKYETRSPFFNQYVRVQPNNVLLNHLHGAVRPLLVADKVVGSEHHLADVTVKTCFMPVLTEKKTNHITLWGCLKLTLKLHSWHQSTLS